MLTFNIIHMKAVIITLIGFLFVAGNLRAQDHKKFVYTNHTEFGGLFGRAKYPTPFNGNEEQVANRLSATMQTFNGILITRRLAAGVTVGMDWYKTALINPISAGIRYEMTQNSNVKLYGTVDAGYGFAWFHDDIDGFDTQGGLMLNPGIGLKIGKPGEAAFTLTVSYKRQEAHIDKAPLWDQLERSEERVYNRLALRIGIAF